MGIRHALCVLCVCVVFLLLVALPFHFPRRLDGSLLPVDTRWLFVCLRYEILMSIWLLLIY